MRNTFLILTALLGLFILPHAASAADGMVVELVNVRSGPSSYPIIGRIRSHERINVVGCNSARSWCDVQSGSVRGWIPSKYVLVNNGRSRAGVNNYYSRRVVPVVGFAERDYWSKNYSDRDFYRAKYAAKHEDDHRGWHQEHGKWVRDSEHHDARTAAEVHQDDVHHDDDHHDWHDHDHDDNHDDNHWHHDNH